MASTVSQSEFSFTDVTFQKPLTPLESALSVLEMICTEINVAQEILEQVHTSVREMVRLDKLVCGCILSFFFIDEMFKHYNKVFTRPF